MNRKKLIYIFIPVCLLVLYRFAMTLPLSGLGRYKSSPHNSQVAWVTEYTTEYFFGGKHDFSIIEIRDENNNKILKHRYDHPGRHFEWYQKGEIIWETPKIVRFMSDSKTILFLYL
jgi:hypothetical protein